MALSTAVRTAQPQWESEISPAVYRASFGIELPSFEHKWSLTQDAEGTFQVGLPNRVVLQFSTDPAAIADPEAPEWQTSMLWKHSLAILPLLLHHDQAELVDEFLEGYSTFLDTPGWVEISTQMASLDHCIALRIRCLCLVRAYYAQVGQALPDAADDILRRDLAWASEPARYAQNNHGLMLAMAVAHAAEIFPQVTSPGMFRAATTTAIRILRRAFGHDWVCIENTPEYQGYFLRLCQSLRDFLKVSRFVTAPVITELDETLTHAAATLTLMVRPDGRYPPLGDSGATPPSGMTSTDGELVSRATGLYVGKHDGVFFSFKCGYKSHVHKHMDDTSISLTIDDEELLLDAGLHNYDWHDPITRAIKSQRGHSGFFFPQFDELYPGSMYRPEHYRVKSELSLLSRAGGAVRLAGTSIIDETHGVTRLVTHRAGVIDLVDRYWVTTHAEAAPLPVQRFLVPATMGVEYLSAQTTRFTGEHAWLEIEVDPSRELTVHEGTGGDLPRGWFSRRWSEAEPCRSIDISVAEGKPAWARVRYGRITTTANA
ncbi:MAG: hypothetical protein ACK5LN_13055 [Propioniciclava sp.]